MKQKLLLALLALFTGVGTLSAQLENGTVYWIQDISNGQFISGGASWGTQATMKDVGGLGFEATQISEGVYTLKNIMINKVHNLSKGLGDNLYVDNGSPAEWTLTASGEGFTIKNGNNYLCNNLSANELGVKALGTTTDAAVATVWKFLTRTEYDTAIQAHKNNNAATIAISMGLTNISSVSDLETAIANTNNFLISDATESINNPTLASNWDGWTHAGTPGSNRGEGAGVGDGCAEFWNGCGYAKQTISGLATGIYKVQFAGTYRPGNSGPAQNLTSEQTSSPAFGFANNEKVELVHWIDVPAHANGRSTIYSNKEDYSNIIYTYVSDGTLTLGVVSDYWNNDNNYQWCPFGQFTLTYYTNQVSDDDIATLVARIPDIPLPTAVKNNLDLLKETLESDKTIAAYNALNTAIEEANKISDTYSQYPVIKTRMQTIKDAAGFSDTNNAAQAFDDVITAQDEAVEQATIVDDVQTCIDAVRTAAGTFLGAVEVTGTIDATALIMNDTPTSNGDFWTLTGNPEFDAANNVAEYWNQSGASIKQVIYGLPAGYYTLSAVALSRPNQMGVLSANENRVNLVQHFEQPSGNRTEGGNWFNNGNGVNTLSFHLENPIDVEIGIMADNANGDHWTLWRNFKLEFFGTDPLAAEKALYQEALANAQDVLEAYSIVTGEERSALNQALTDYGNVVANYEDVEGSKSAFQEAIDALNVAAQTVKDAAPSYQAYNDEKVKAEIIGLTTEIPAVTTAAEATSAVNTIKVAESTYVNANYPSDVSTLAGDLSTWTGNGGTGTSNNQHWSGQTKVYYEQSSSNWGASAWEISYTKTTTLPAGKYMAKVAARGSVALTYSNLCISATENVMPLTHKGDSGKGITTDGATSFDEGEFANNNNGRGWEWGYLPFELTEGGEVTFTLASKAEASMLWVSYCDFALLSSAENIDYTALLTAIEEAQRVNNDMEVAALTSAITTAEAALLATTQEEVDAATEALIAATNTAKSTIAARKNLIGVAKKANVLKSYLTEDISEAITEATQYAANAEATANEANTKADALNANFAEWEIITLNNGTFDTGLNGDLIAPGTEAKPYVHAVDGWTQNFTFKSTASQGIAAAYGSAAQDGTNGTNAPATDMFGKSEGGTLHLSSGWSDQARYYQVVDNLPAGKYVFYYEGYNANNTTNALNSNYFGIGDLTAGDLEGTQNTFKYSDEKSFTYNEWKAVAFDFTLTKTIGSAKINVGLIGGTGGSGSTPKMWFDNVTIYCIEKTSETVTVTVNKNASDADGYCYGTLYYSDKNLVVPEGLTAYTYIVTDGTLSESKTYETGAVIPAATGVVVKTANNSLTENASFDFTVTAESGEVDNNNMLHGTDEAAMTNAGDGNWKYYALSLNSSNTAGTVGFYFRKGCPNGQAFQNGAHKAYLAVPVAQAKGMSGFAFGSETDGIGQIENAELTMENATIYNLAGQKVNNTQKGVYIVNGKKVVIK